MTFICIWNPGWEGTSDIVRLAPAVLKVVPRISLDTVRGLIWADGRSLNCDRLSANILTQLKHQNATNTQLGVSIVPVVAEVAARYRGNDPNSVRPVTAVVPGDDRDFLARHSISVLVPSPPLVTMFEGVGIETCGDLARLDQESVEVRFGAEGVHLWRLSRADDRRLIFTPMSRSLPDASLDWVDYTLTDPERLVFVINALVDSVSTALASRGLCAREMTLVFSLASKDTYEHLVRPSRATSSRKAWMRLIRTHLDRITLSDAVTGILLRVDSATGEVERQGDVFDRGFATARATEETVGQLLDDQGAVIVVPSNNRHPLVERRTTWASMEPAHAARAHMSREMATAADPRLTLQLLAVPRRIVVRTVRRRDHELPLEYQDTNAWVPIQSAAGPDRVSGGQWEEPYAREYFRCVTGEG
ncbi:MAG: hypothetical protein ABIR58_00800, partial [Gemmatimonadaceae bacterium]